MRPTHSRIRERMAAVRDAMNAGLWRRASALVEAAIQECRRIRCGHAEASWALAVCLEVRGDLPGALVAVEKAIDLDPTALTWHETRDALLQRLRDRAGDPATDERARRRATALLTARNALRTVSQRARSRARRRSRR